VGDLGGISSGQETYRIALSMRIFIPFFYLFALVVAVGFLGDMSSSDQGGLLFFILWCIGLVASGWWTLLRMPWRVRTDDRGTTSWRGHERSTSPGIDCGRSVALGTT
jgi:hypothetical protein